MIEKIMNDETNEAIDIISQYSGAVLRALHLFESDMETNIQSIFDEVRTSDEVSQANRFSILCESYSYTKNFITNWNEE